jgi:CheY-like chemotaxis protein
MHNPAVAQFLVIDDEPAVSVTLARMLELGGHQVALVESGSAALAALESSIPDAIILDIRMPGMNGVEFLRLIRADRRVAHIPVGVLTGDHFLKESVLAELALLNATVRYKPLWLDDVADLARQLTQGPSPAGGGR